MSDFDLNEFLPKSDRLKGELLEQWGWDGQAVTISHLGQKTYPAREGKAEEKKLQVFFHELPGWPLECNGTQVKKLRDLFGEKTSAWPGRQVILLSIDTQTPQGQPAKTIQIKEVRQSAPTAPGQPTAPNASQFIPPPSRKVPNEEIIPPHPIEQTAEGDPFSDEPATAAQIKEIERLCAEARFNTELTAVKWFNKNLMQLNSGEATEFIVKLGHSISLHANEQTAAAIAR